MDRNHSNDVGMTERSAYIVQITPYENWYQHECFTISNDVLSETNSLKRVARRHEIHSKGTDHCYLKNLMHDIFLEMLMALVILSKLVICYQII